MDKELPWLADNAQLELKYKKGKTPLSHRKWPGEPVPVITESIWICPYISRHLLSLNPLQARCRRYSRGER